MPPYVILGGIVLLFIAACLIAAFGENIARWRYRRRYGDGHRIRINITESSDAG